MINRGVIQAKRLVFLILLPLLGFFLFSCGAPAERQSLKWMGQFTNGFDALLSYNPTNQVSLSLAKLRLCQNPARLVHVTLTGTIPPAPLPDPNGDWFLNTNALTLVLTTNYLARVRFHDTLEIIVHRQSSSASSPHHQSDENVRSRRLTFVRNDQILPRSEILSLKKPEFTTATWRDETVVSRFGARVQEQYFVVGLTVTNLGIPWKLIDTANVQAGGKVTINWTGARKSIPTTRAIPFHLTTDPFAKVWKSSPRETITNEVAIRFTNVSFGGSLDRAGAIAAMSNQVNLSWSDLVQSNAGFGNLQYDSLISEVITNFRIPAPPNGRPLDSNVVVSSTKWLLLKLAENQPDFLVVSNTATRIIFFPKKKLKEFILDQAPHSQSHTIEVSLQIEELIIPYENFFCGRQ